MAAKPSDLSRSGAHSLSPGTLTPKEREVVLLIVDGRTNREIATSLVIAHSTAERHVANILSQLALRSRAEIAVWALEHGFARGAAGAESRFPNALSVSRQMHSNLPVEVNSFVGRERELEELSELATSTRLLTLMGAGGIGKTDLPYDLRASSRRTMPTASG